MTDGSGVKVRKLAVLGCGTMGQAVVRGLLASAQGPLWTAAGSVKHAASASQVSASLGIPVTTNSASAAEGADVVLVGVKPQGVAELFANPAVREAVAGKLVISICAGVTLAQLQSYAPLARFVRAMPNTPALIGEGMTVISPSEATTEEDLAVATGIFTSVGRCRTLDERHLDTVTGLSGSGPAFACVILESLADGGVMMGLPRDVAIELAAQTMQGAARLVLQTGAHPAALRDSVTTPAGCTIAGLFVMEDGRIRSTLARTVQEAARVAAGLGKPSE